jgi:hypothetical protein
MVRRWRSSSIGFARLCAAGAIFILIPASPPQRVAGQSRTDSQLVMLWIARGIGQCASGDSGQSPGLAQPDPARCTPATAGTASVCWGTYPPHSNGFVGCTYNNVAPSQCTGGNNPGYLFECLAIPAKPVGGSELFGPWQPGTGLFDGDNYLAVNAPNPEACMAACGLDPRCASASYTPPAALPGITPRNCYLQAKVSGLRPFPGGFTSAKREGAGVSGQGAAAATMPSGQCDISGLWRVGASDWWITPSGAASEIGEASAAGVASLSGHRLTIRWKTDEGMSGTHSVDLDAGCGGGIGQTETGGRTTSLRLCRGESCS